MSMDKIAVIGLGKVGTTFAHLLQKAGYGIVALFDTDAAASDRALTYVDAAVFPDPASAASAADTVIIATNDDAIEYISRNIAAAGAITSGMKIIHTSGAGSLDLLSAARQRGASVGCLHPIQTFSDIDGAITNVPGSVFGIVADEDIKSWLGDMAGAMGGHPVFISDGDKPLYHAAAVFASNYLVTLIHAAVALYSSLGMSEDEALTAIRPLIAGTVRNIEENGPVRALTGPIARGDIGTVRRHLASLTGDASRLLPLYRLLGEMTVDLALTGGSLTRESARTINNILQGEKFDHE